MVMGDVIGVTKITCVKNGSKCHHGLMSQNFQFMKVNIVNITPKAVSTPNKNLEPPLVYILKLSFAT